MLGITLLIAAASAKAIVGTWEGTSLCQVKPSPCHDEHVIYRIRSSHAGYSIDAYKLVAGKDDFMGTIDVTPDAAGAQFDGPVMSRGQLRARLHLTMKGRHISGRMTDIDGTLYRLIEVDKR